jgi:hypothetical protein
LSLNVIILSVVCLTFLLNFAMFLAVFAILRVLLDIASLNAVREAGGFLSGLKTNDQGEPDPPFVQGEVVPDTYFDITPPVSEQAVAVRKRSWT